MPAVVYIDGHWTVPQFVTRASIACASGGGECHETSDILPRAVVACASGGGECHETSDILPRAVVACASGGGECHETSDILPRAVVACASGGGECHETPDVLPRAVVACASGGGECHETSDVLPRAIVACASGGGECHETSDILPRAVVACASGGGECHETPDILPRAFVACASGGGECHESSDILPRASVSCDRASGQCFESQIVARSDDSNGGIAFNSTTMSLLIVLVVLLLFGVCLIGTLLCLRSRRRKQKQQIGDMPFQASPRPASRFSTHTILTIATGPFGRNAEPSINEKEILIDERSMDSPIERVVPEIHITFPEEVDEVGKRISGRIVKVSISEAGGVGLEPYNDEHLPAYQKFDAERFQSLDLERMGGLKEMEKSKN